MKALPEIDVLRVIARYGPVRGTLSLHRLVHELQERGVLRVGFSFVRYSFGYYSGELEGVLARLEGLGLVRVSRSAEGLEVYEVTDRGLKILEAVSETGGRDRPGYAH